VLPLSKPYIDKAGTSHDTLMYISRQSTVHSNKKLCNIPQNTWTDHTPSAFSREHGQGDLGR
jgi:hypothetical protein